MARRRPPEREPGEPPSELRPEAWEAWADPADLGERDPAAYRARAHVRQGEALSAWAAEAGLSWVEANRRAGRGEA